jgi:hypothetical protein
LPDCNLPKNQEKISEGKKNMQDAMKKSRRNTGGGTNNAIPRPSPRMKFLK